jgi:endonuclease-8
VCLTTLPPQLENVGKNLFGFFTNEMDCALDSPETVVINVHFGMAGAWPVIPEMTVTPTTRLALEHISNNDESPCYSVVSAMTLLHGTYNDLFFAKRKTLGEDPLRADADPEDLYDRIQKSKKSIGALIMDQVRVRVGVRACDSAVSSLSLLMLFAYAAPAVFRGSRQYLQM